MFQSLEETYGVEEWHPQPWLRWGELLEGGRGEPLLATSLGALPMEQPKWKVSLVPFSPQSLGLVYF